MQRVVGSQSKVTRLARLGNRRNRYSSVSGYGSSPSSEYRVIQLDPNNEPTESPFPRNRITSTKYTVWNFVPKNLFEQFRRVANFYFLVTAIVAASIKSPISPLTSSLPLLFVILVTACKQGYEDLVRNRSDRRLNKLPITVVRRKCSQEIPCQDIVVGDIVRVNRDEDVPCDLVILHSSEPCGKCYVTTSNLDGETNLKTMQVPRILADLEIEQLVSMRAIVTCQQPIAGLYTFEGRLEATVPLGDGEDHGDASETRRGPLGIENIVLRGARLKDTDCVLGCAVYTGKDTKLSLNSKLIVNKFSSVEKSINKYVLMFIVFLLAEVGVCTALKVLVENSAVWEAYLGNPVYSVYANVHNDILSFAILFNYVVPISLYVTLELQKFIGSLFFSWDLGMYDRSLEQPAIANTSDLNEDLGQVEYLFSDKTGTLTENLMIFRRCFVDGRSYLEKDCDGNLHRLPANGLESDVEKVETWTPEIWHLMLSISICHTVHIAPDSQKAKAELRRAEFRESFRLKRVFGVNSSLMMHPDLPEYQAASADEKALVEAAARCGVVYLGGRSNAELLEISAKGTKLGFYRLDTLEFNSDRKRMSVIVRDTAGDVWLYCKGADTTVFPLVLRGKVESARASIVDFSTRGLRTLVIGFKKLTEDEYQRHSREISLARQAIGAERTKRIDKAYLEAEKGLTLLGVTAVEDRLQEGVPETIEKLRIAGIKVWVLTGDKAETAENIASFCGHFKKDTTILRLMSIKSISMCYGVLTSFERKLKLDPLAQYGLLVDGMSAGIALKNCPSLLASVGMACEAVVCCRMSPLQKSQIVQLVKHSRDKPLTAAIGDGGNDVSMIKEAHVGLGIVGKEGRQAAMSADFAFGRFVHLDRALLVHGHWYYLRVAVLTQFFFYKNLVFITPQLFFSAFNGFSAQALYDSIFLMCFNIFFSSVPILVYGILEQNCSAEKLLKFPQLYRLHKRNYLLSPAQFSLWILMAIWQTCTVYFVSHFYYTVNPVNLYDGTQADHWCFSTSIFHHVTLVINLQLLVISSYWTIPFALSILATEFFFFIFTFFYCFWDLQYDGNMYRVFPKLILSPTFWILTLVAIVISLIPTFLVVIYQTSRCSRLCRESQSRKDDTRSKIIYSRATRLSVASPVLPNRRSSTVIPWRGHFSCYDNKAFYNA